MARIAVALAAIAITGLIVALVDQPGNRSGAHPNAGRSQLTRAAASTANGPPPAATSVAAAVATPTLVGSLTYIVKPGDTLASIADSFHLQGYGAMYDANKVSIGDNPNLIYPGEIITITPPGVTIGK